MSNKSELLKATIVLMGVVASVLLPIHLAQIGMVSDLGRLGLTGASIIVLGTVYFITMSPEERAARLRPNRKRHASLSSASDVPSAGSSATQTQGKATISKSRTLAVLIVPWLLLAPTFYVLYQARLPRIEAWAVLVVVVVGIRFIQFRLTRKYRTKAPIGS